MSIPRRFVAFIPFWIFLTLYKIGGGLHYSLISPLGERLLPLWLVGLLMGGGSLIHLLLDVPAGHWLDRFGYRRLLKLTTFIFLLAGLVLVINFNTLTYITSLIVATFGWLFFVPGVNAYVLTHAPRAGSGRFIAYRDVFASLGIVLSTALLGLVLTLPTYLIGLMIALAMLAALIALYASPPDTPLTHTEPKIATQAHYIHRHFLKDTLTMLRRLNPASTMLVLLNLVSASFYAIIWFVVPLIIAHQVHPGWSGLTLGIFDFTVVLLGFFLGNLADRANKRTLVFFGLLLFAVAGMFLGFNFGWLFLVFGFLATTGDEMAGIALWSWLYTLDHKHANDGLLAGVLNVFDDLGWTIGPVVAGILYSLVGPAWTIAVGSSLIFCTWCIYQVFMRHHKYAPAADIPRRPQRKRHKV
ncbi:MFS transporter [Candidatus Falkowbacteria bacterium]|nr:MFS transporter [Candidatus Falkowbacteria bacterium]